MGRAGGSDIPVPHTQFLEGGTAARGGAGGSACHLTLSPAVPTCEGRAWSRGSPLGVTLLPGDTGSPLGTCVVVTLETSWHRVGGGQEAVPRTAPLRRTRPPSAGLRGRLCFRGKQIKAAGCFTLRNQVPVLPDNLGVLRPLLSHPSCSTALPSLNSCQSLCLPR